MARLYMDEQFPKIVSQLLREMGHIDRKGGKSPPVFIER